MDNSIIKTFFDNIECYTSFERKKKMSELTNNYDLNLLTEFSNSFVEHCFNKFYEFNSKLPNIEIEQIENEEGVIWLNEFHFPFYDFIKGEIHKGIRIEKFNNISFNDCIKFNSFMNDFLDEIETIIENQDIKINGKNTTHEPEAIDLSDTTATEKIIYLHKLGVIDFLRKQQPFQSSINSLATVLSAVTGAKSGTIQPMLNAMLGKNVEQKNNPLNSQKPVSKVIKQLNQIGFNLDETN